MVVYVQDKENIPLMPTKRLGMVRRWLKSGRAQVVRREPFTIQLIDLIGGWSQPLNAGIDLGTVHVGVSVITHAQEVFAGEFQLRSDIHGLLTDRHRFRRVRRSRKTRYRPARYLNRKRKDELMPTIRAKVDETLKIIQLINNILPVGFWMFEIGNFDPHKIAHPTVEGDGYQYSEQYGFENVRAFVLWRDHHECQSCHGKSGDPKLTVHHIQRRADGGSDRPANLITLCQTCHHLHHQGQPLNLKAPPSLRDVTQFNIIKAYVMRETTHLPRGITYGYITKAYRIELGLSKSHINDAFVIAGGQEQWRAQTMYLGIFARRQNRKLFKGARSHLRNTIPGAKGFRRGDRVQLPNGHQGFIYGLRSSGNFDVRRLDGTVISHWISHKKLRRLESARTLRIERSTITPIHTKQQFLLNNSEGD
jgi:RRXRR protein/HNH endonuclease